MKKLIKKVINLFKPTRIDLTREAANIITRFGRSGKLEDFVSIEIKHIEQVILEESMRERSSIIFLIPKNQSDLYKLIEKHFKDKGFKVIKIDNSIEKGLDEDTFLYISWR